MGNLDKLGEIPPAEFRKMMAIKDPVKREQAINNWTPNQSTADTISKRDRAHYNYTRNRGKITPREDSPFIATEEDYGFSVTCDADKLIEEATKIREKVANEKKNQAKPGEHIKQTEGVYDNVYVQVDEESNTILVKGFKTRNLAEAASCDEGNSLIAGLGDDFAGWDRDETDNRHIASIYTADNEVAYDIKIISDFQKEHQYVYNAYHRPPFDSEVGLHEFETPEPIKPRELPDIEIEEPDNGPEIYC